jgi:cold-inducible RNA-binding protein
MHIRSRVKCTVCTNTWYQSRDRLFDIPTETHDMIPANKSDLDRIARNLAHDCPPNFMGVNKLYVGNLDFRTTSDELLEFFERNSDKAGSVCDVSMVKGPDGRSRGFAFVTFYEEADGKAALMCNGMECNGRELSVKEPNN